MDCIHYTSTQKIYSANSKPICTAIFSAASTKSQWKSTFSLAVILEPSVEMLADFLTQPQVEINFH